MTNTEHRGDPGEYTPSCPCVPCEKHRAKNGLSMLNPRAAIDGSTEQRPASFGAELR